MGTLTQWQWDDPEVTGVARATETRAYILVKLWLLFILYSTQNSAVAQWVFIDQLNEYVFLFG